MLQPAGADWIISPCADGQIEHRASGTTLHCLEHADVPQRLRRAASEVLARSGRTAQTGAAWPGCTWPARGRIWRPGPRSRLPGCDLPSRPTQPGTSPPAGTQHPDGPVCKHGSLSDHADGNRQYGLCGCTPLHKQLSYITLCLLAGTPYRMFGSLLHLEAARRQPWRHFTADFQHEVLVHRCSQRSIASTIMHTADRYLQQP